MASNSAAEELSKKIKEAGDNVRKLKADKAAKVGSYFWKKFASF